VGERVITTGLGTRLKKKYLLNDKIAIFVTMREITTNISQIKTWLSDIKQAIIDNLLRDK